MFNSRTIDVYMRYNVLIAYTSLESTLCLYGAITDVKSLGLWFMDRYSSKEIYIPYSCIQHITRINNL